MTMRLPIWIVLLAATVLLSLVGMAAFLLGRDFASSQPSQISNESPLSGAGALSQRTSLISNGGAIEATRAEPSLADLIIGNWAPADSGCSTDYGAGYTSGGRFIEGDAGEGIEGRWTIREGILERQITTTYEDNGYEIISKNQVLPVDRLMIVDLNNRYLIVDYKGRRFSYVKCTQGQRHFPDGEILHSS